MFANLITYIIRLNQCPRKHTTDRLYSYFLKKEFNVLGVQNDVPNKYQTKHLSIQPLL